MSKVIVDEIQTDTTDGNVRIIPNGEGKLEVKGAGGDDAMIQLNCSVQSHGVKLKSPAHSASQSYTMILPDNNIAADKVLKVKNIASGSGTSAVGQLEFANAGDLSGLLKEKFNTTNGKLSDNTNIDLENGMIHYFITTESTTSTPNIRFNSTTSLNSSMNTGEAISVTIITNAAAAGYSAQLSIDGTTGFGLTHWVGGSAPSNGGSSGVDIYSYTILKIGDATFKVIGNQSKTS